MARNLADLQAEIAARGYVHDFGTDRETLATRLLEDLRLVDSVSLDSGTDPGDDVTLYLIESRRRKGYLIISDSFHADPDKAALVTALQASG